MKMFISLFIVAVFAEFSIAQFFDFQSRSCLNPNQHRGTCVSVYDCQTLLSVLQRSPLTANDIAFVKASQCAGGFGNSPHVCCTGDTGFITELQPVRRETPNNKFLFPHDDSNQQWSSSSRDHRGWQDGDGGFDDDYDFGEDRRRRRQRVTMKPTIGTDLTSMVPQVPVCGGVTISNKIYGGSDADLFEFPWMALLEYTRRNELVTSCAGSLINQRYVLTAAHCVKGIERKVDRLIGVRLGEHDTSKQIDCNRNSCASASIRVGVEAIIPHESYKEKSTNNANDIALIRLDRTIQFTDSMRPICLPSAVGSEQLKSGASLTVAGWGRTLRSIKSAVKQKLNVAVVDQRQCSQRYGQRKVQLLDSQLCAGGKFAEDSCEGDSGGPLMRVRNGAWVLEGIVSFGIKCGLKDWPAVYTRVSSFDEWIRSNLKP